VLFFVSFPLFEVGEAPFFRYEENLSLPAISASAFFPVSEVRALLAGPAGPPRCFFLSCRLVSASF